MATAMLTLDPDVFTAMCGRDNVHPDVVLEAIERVNRELGTATVVITPAGLTRRTA